MTNKGYNINYNNNNNRNLNAQETRILIIKKTK